MHRRLGIAQTGGYSVRKEALPNASFSITPTGLNGNLFSPSPPSRIRPAGVGWGGLVIAGFAVKDLGENLVHFLRQEPPRLGCRVPDLLGQLLTALGSPYGFSLGSAYGFSLGSPYGFSLGSAFLSEGFPVFFYLR